MPNVAVNKQVVESFVEHANVVTDGNTTNYTGNRGFAYFNIPGTLTVDLKKIHPIKCIRILLWDGLGEGKTRIDSRKYRYRLAVSKDNSDWPELYNTSEEGTIGWQIFTFKNAIQIRYIRIYGLDNTANHQFHVVEVEAHNDYPPKPEGHIGTDIELPGNDDESFSSKGSLQVATRINSNELNKIITTLEQSPLDKTLIQNIKARFEDLIVLDQNLEAIRREIVNPVTNEMQKSNRLAVVALFITIIGLILTIIFSPSGDKILSWLFMLFES